HEGEAFVADQLFGARHSMRRRGSRELDARAQTLGPRALGRRHSRRHDDNGGYAVQLRRERDRLCVIPRRWRDDTARPLVRTQMRQKVVSAAELERAAALEHLGFDPHRNAELLRDDVRRQKRRSHGDGPDGAGGVLKIAECNELSRDHDLSYEKSDIAESHTWFRLEPESGNWKAPIGVRPHF